MLVTAGVVLVTQGTRRIPVQYAKRVVGRKVYGGTTQYLPLRVNAAGVMPIIFAQSIMFIPSTIAAFFPDSAFWLAVGNCDGRHLRLLVTRSSSSSSASSLPTSTRRSR